MEGAARRAREAWVRLRENATAAARDARPWLRRETWTRDNLGRLAQTARQRPRRVLAALLAVLAAGALAGLVLREATDSGAATVPVRQGPFRVTIVEAGTLQALRSVTYASSIQSNQAKIVALAPEGKLVQKGDLLMLFDAAPFEEEIRRNQALLSQAEADLQKARQEIKLQGIQNQEELSAARLKVERSDLELKDVQDGKGRLKEEEASSAVANAERDLSKAKAQLEDLKPLLAEGFITKMELERAEQQVARAEDDLALAKRRRDALLNFGRPLELSQARSDALSSKESFRQLEAASSYRTAQKQAAISSAESRIEEASAKLALAKEQLARCEVRADVPGIVVYKDVFFGSEQRKPQVGDQVWANQPLLILPDISRMVIETKVRETDEARLRPGMTARVEIQVEERKDATYLPLEAVFERDGRPLVYVAHGRTPRPREVVLGPSNQDFVVIERGLEPGERVYLRDPGAPPSDFGGLTNP